MYDCVREKFTHACRTERYYDYETNYQRLMLATVRALARMYASTL